MVHKVVMGDFVRRGSGNGNENDRKKSSDPHQCDGDLNITTICATTSEELKIDQSSHNDAMLLASFADIASKVVAKPTSTSTLHPQPQSITSSTFSTPRFPSLPDPDATKLVIPSSEKHQMRMMAEVPIKAGPAPAPAPAPIPDKALSDLTHHTITTTIATATRPRKISYSNAEIVTGHPHSHQSVSMAGTGTGTGTALNSNCSPTMSPLSSLSHLNLPQQSPPSSSSRSSLPIQPHVPNARTKQNQHHTHPRDAHSHAHAHARRDYKIILRKKFSWKHYPPLEAFLIANRGEYLRHSALNYTSQQKRFNNSLTEQMIQLASQHGLIFDQEEFSFVTIRDRIRCYYKSYVQSLKKKGIICGYAAKKAGMHSFDGHGQH